MPGLFNNICLTSAVTLLWLSALCSWPAAIKASEAGYGYVPAIPDQVWSLKFEGNETFSDMVLKERIATEAPGFFEKLRFWNRGGYALDEVEIQKDVIRIRNFYQRRGFYGVEVDYSIEDGSREWKKKVIFTINENAPILIRNVEFVLETKEEYENYISESPSYRRMKQRQPFQPDSRYETIREPVVIGQVTDLLKDMGFAFAQTTISARVDTSKLAADITIQSVTGPLTRITHIDVEGAETVTESYVVKESGLRQGELYSRQRLQEAQRELFNHHLFRFATISIPEQEQDTSLNLEMRVRENPLRSIQASLGFGTEEYVRGQLSWIHRNAFGNAHKFTATGRASFIEQTASIEYLFPYIFNPKSSIVISPFGQHLLEPAFELFRAGITNSFIYQYRQNATGSISYQFTKNLELSQQLATDLPDTTLAYDLSSLQLAGYYSEQLSRVQRGWLIQPYAEISGLFGLATFSFQKVSIDVRRYLPLTESTTLAARIQTGGIFNVTTDTLPANVRFFLGGTNSVRGWQRYDLGPKRRRVDNQGFVEYIPAGGRAMAGFNIEIRQDLNFLFNGFGIAAFLDGGQIWRRVRRIGNRPIQFGAGGGFRYQSPIGPIRIDVGYKLNPTQEDLGIYSKSYGSIWRRIGIHFSIGQAF